ncbi:MAG: type II secretion system secretin GspD [Deltaproteobacteria bacterium]|nr:type II secretion system secretin GspD [Deltaproteobacteria bacterium]
MKFRTAVALVLCSLMTFVASFSVAQTRPRPRPRSLIPGVVRPNNALPPLSQFTQATATPPTDGTTPPTTPGSLREFDAGLDYQPLPAGARITFNLQDADLPDLVRAIGNITGRRFIISGKARSIKATIYSPTKVSAGEAYQAFLSVLQTNGMTVIPSGRYLKIEESAGAATAPLPLYSSGESVPGEDRFVTRIHRVRNMAAEDAAQLLGHFKSRDGDITPYAATNTLVITDTGINLRRMMSILAEVDVPSVGEQIWIEALRYASAAEAVQRINEILGTTGAPAVAPGRPGSEVRLARLVAEERSNSVVIVATERMYQRVLELIRVIDRPGVSEAGNMHVYAVQHADSEELAGTINNIVSGGRQAGQAAGQRGATSVFEGSIRITADKRTNSVVVTSTSRDFVEVRRLIERLDRSRRQVFIEAAVMELEVTNSNQFGVSFHAGGALNDFLGIPGATIPLGGFQASQSVFFPNQDSLTGLALGVRGPSIPNVQLPIPGVTLGIPAFGVVLRALAESGDADVLATPSIIATDNETADINVGANIALQNNVGGGAGAAAGAAGAAGLGGLLGAFGGFSAPRGDVGTKIRVVPHINDSNEIRLEIDEEISEAGAADGALGVVPINRRTAKTKVVVQDQQTVVIGGLIRNSVRRSNTRIPILGDLPLIGALFRTETRRVERRNLLLFMTPYVIRDQSDLRRIFERKMRERQEFLDRYFVLSSNNEVRPEVDYSRTNGLVEEIRQSIRAQREETERNSINFERAAPLHGPSAPIDLPSYSPASSRGPTLGTPTLRPPDAPQPTATVAPTQTAPTPVTSTATAVTAPN